MDNKYTIGEIGLKIKSSASSAKSISIIRKYKPVSMADIKSSIESNDYLLTSLVIDHSGVKRIRKCFDELEKSGVEVELYERDQMITREILSNLISSHRQTDLEVEALVDDELAEEGNAQ